jgi:hypothetical protein
MGRQDSDFLTQTELQALCQSPTSQRYKQNFVKEPASQPNEEKKF